MNSASQFTAYCTYLQRAPISSPRPVPAFCDSSSELPSHKYAMNCSQLTPNAAERRWAMREPVICLLLTPKEAARSLGISERLLWGRSAPRGEIPVVRIGRSVRYSLDDLRSFIESQKEVR